jgi:hypothetical protein
MRARALVILVRFVQKCNADVFNEGLLIPSLKTGEFYQLLDYMVLLDRTQQKFYSYFVAIGKYLEKNAFLSTLYDFQLFMKVSSCQ